MEVDFDAFFDSRSTVGIWSKMSSFYDSNFFTNLQNYDPHPLYLVSDFLHDRLDFCVNHFEISNLKNFLSEKSFETLNFKVVYRKCRRRVKNTTPTREGGDYSSRIS